MPIELQPKSIQPNPDSSTSSSLFPTSSSSSTKLTVTKRWKVPPRPKPGRKPKPIIDIDRRKAQNRAAQKAYRERKQNKVAELEMKLTELKKEQEFREKLLQDELEIMTNSCKKLQQRLHLDNKEIDFTDSFKKNNDTIQLPSINTLNDSIQSNQAQCSGNPQQCGKCHNDPVAGLYCVSL